MSRPAGLRPSGGSRRNLWRRPANSTNSSVLAKLSPTQTRRPSGETEARGGDARPALPTAWLLEWGRGAAGKEGSRRARPGATGTRVSSEPELLRSLCHPARAMVPAEKGRKAARFTKHPLASRKWPGLNWRGVSHCVLSRSTELSRGTTGVPCGRAAGGAGSRCLVHLGRPQTAALGRVPEEGGKLGRPLSPCLLEVCWRMGS